MRLSEHLGRFFKKTDDTKKAPVGKSGVAISDKPGIGRQDAFAGRIFPLEPSRNPPEAGQSGNGIAVDFEGFGDVFDFFSCSRPESGPRPGPDLYFTLEITPETALAGTDCDLEVTHTEACGSCGGSGSGTLRTSTCPACGGGRYERKEMVSPHGSFVQTKTCTACGGRGVVPEQACRKCQGTGHVYVERTVTVHIPADTKNHSRIYYEGLGDAGDYQAKNGNLVVSILFC